MRRREYLAAGTPTYHLKSSDPNIDASAISYQGSVVLSAALFKPTYHRWVDEGIVEDVTIDCPCPLTHGNRCVGDRKEIASSPFLWRPMWCVFPASVQKSDAGLWIGLVDTEFAANLWTCERVVK